VADYAVDVKASARKELESLPNKALATAVNRIESLGQDPRPPGCKKLKGHKDKGRIRVGDWRVVYIINDPARSSSV